MSDRPRVALVGCGWFACEAHLPALRRLEKDGRIEIVALCSRSESSLARARKLLGRESVTTYTDIHDLLADPSVDVVDLVLPIATMPAAIRAALRAGKHVISEKPCAPTVAQSLDLLREHSRMAAPPIWAVAENWRFKPAATIIEQLVASGAIGAVHFADFRHVTFTGTQNLGWRGAPDYPGGALLDSGVHFVALLRKIVGEVERVGATVSQRLDHLPPADSVTAVLSFAGGAEGTFRLSFAAHDDESQPGLSLVGSNGTLLADFRRNRIAIRGPAGRRRIAVKADSWVQGGVHATLSHCIDALVHGIPLQSTPWEGLRDVAVIEAMLESGRASRPVVPASLYPMLHGCGRPIDAYAGVWTAKPRHVVDCGSVAEVRAAVLGAAAAGLQVRAMGNGQSWAPHLATRDVCLTLGRLNRIGPVDVARKTVTVGAGARLGDVTRALARHKLSLPSLSFLSDASIGGAVATATHGTSPRAGTLSDAVRSLTMVLASGEVRTIGPESPDDLRAARVAVGTLGIVVAVELQAVDMPFVRFHDMTMDLSAFLARRAAILARYDHVWVHWTLGADKVVVKALEQRGSAAKGFHPYVDGDNAVWESPSTVGQAVRRAKGAARRLRAVWRVLSGRTPPPVRSADEHPGQVHMSMQYGVAAARLEEAVARIRSSEVARAEAGRIVELKFLKGSDRSDLGPNADGDVVLFNLWWLVNDDAGKRTVFDAFEAVMRGLLAKPHWGKAHSAPDVAYMRSAYPRWTAFEAVRARFDPKGTFSIFPADVPAPSKQLVGADGP